MKFFVSFQFWCKEVYFISKRCIHKMFCKDFPLHKLHLVMVRVIKQLRRALFCLSDGCMFFFQVDSRIECNTRLHVSRLGETTRTLKNRIFDRTRQRCKQTPYFSFPLCYRVYYSNGSHSLLFP